MTRYRVSGTEWQGPMTGVPEVRRRTWLSHESSFATKVTGSPETSGSSQEWAHQETTSEGHRWPPRKGEAFTDLGGAFLTRRNFLTRVKSVSISAPAGFVTGFDYARLRGGMPASPLLNGVFLPETLSTELTSEGMRALNEMRPTAPLSGLGVTIGELKDGLPSIIGSGMLKATLSQAKRDRRLLREGSKEYLNWEFGWKPLVSDLRDAAKAVTRSERIINQLYRDSGKDVRRRFGFPVEREDPVVTASSGRLPQLRGSSQLWSATGTLYVTTENIRNVWVSGMCRYYVPEADDLRSRIQRQAMVANRLLGLRPDPELLWELAPWSWLADWVGSIGSLMGNLSAYAFDGLVWKYAYLMEHVVERKSYDLRGARQYNGYIPPCSAVAIRESKRRVSATPFGFGLSLDSFTLRQWSILAALGISRGNL